MDEKLQQLQDVHFASTFKSHGVQVGASLKADEQLQQLQAVQLASALVYQSNLMVCRWAHHRRWMRSCSSCRRG